MGDEQADQPGAARRQAAAARAAALAAVAELALAARAGSRGRPVRRAAWNPRRDSGEPELLAVHHQCARAEDQDRELRQRLKWLEHGGDRRSDQRQALYDGHPRPAVRGPELAA